jgi:hypothetical protein
MFPDFSAFQNGIHRLIEILPPPEIKRVRKIYCGTGRGTADRVAFDETEQRRTFQKRTAFR